MPPRKAASSFSLRPAIGRTRPRSVNLAGHGDIAAHRMPVITETIAVTMATPRRSILRRAPSGTSTSMCACRTATRCRRRPRAAHVAAAAEIDLLHHVAQVAGHRHAALAGHYSGFDGEQLAADIGPGEPGRRCRSGPCPRPLRSGTSARRDIRRGNWLAPSSTSSPTDQSLTALRIKVESSRSRLRTPLLACSGG